MKNYLEFYGQEQLITDNNYVSHTFLGCHVQSQIPLPENTGRI